MKTSSSTYLTTRASTQPTVTLTRRCYPTKVADRSGIQPLENEGGQAYTAPFLHADAHTLTFLLFGREHLASETNPWEGGGGLLQAVASPATILAAILAAIATGAVTANVTKMMASGKENRRANGGDREGTGTAPVIERATKVTTARTVGWAPENGAWWASSPIGAWGPRRGEAGRGNSHGDSSAGAELAVDCAQTPRSKHPCGSSCHYTTFSPSPCGGEARLQGFISRMLGEC